MYSDFDSSKDQRYMYPVFNVIYVQVLRNATSHMGMRVIVGCMCFKIVLFVHCEMITCSSFCISVPDGYFKVTFMELIRRKAVSFRNGMTQQEVLTSSRWEEVDRRVEILDYLADHPESEYEIFDENPLDFGYYLDTISATGIYVHVLSQY